MTIEEKEEWIDKIADIAYELEDLKQLAEDAIETETDTVKEWKKKVLDSIPKKCSITKSNSSSVRVRLNRRISP